MAVARKRQVQDTRPKLILTKVFQRNIDAYTKGKRRAMNEGGTASSKTYSILQCLVMIATDAEAHQEPMLISVVSESLPHLKLGCIRDFFKIMATSEDDPRWSKTNFVFTFGKYAAMEFFGADDVGKAHGPRRQVLHLNEANHIPWDTARALDIRTEKFTFVDWNPTGEFWAHQYESSDGKTMVPGWISEPDTEYIHSTYLDALAVIPPEVVKNIESNKKDPNWWHIYGLGLIGKIDGLVYKPHEVVDALPEGRVFYGLDFGFSDDPAVLVANVAIGDKLYSKEIFYERGLTNDALARKMDLAGVSKTDPIYADAAEPKSIEEIRRKGYNIVATEKGPGSVDYGIQKVNQHAQFWTKDSVQCIKEQMNFHYLKKKDPTTGKEYLSDETSHMYSHGLDARRYALAGHRMTGGIFRAIQSLHFAPVGSYR